MIVTFTGPTGTAQMKPVGAPAPIAMAYWSVSLCGSSRTIPRQSLPLQFPSLISEIIWVG